MATQPFHRFPDLPRELRDDIWRQCLPHRIVELDLPDLAWYSDFGSHLSYHDLDKQRRRPCELWPTSWRNCATPIITRVCRESRRVAFETAQFAVLDNPHSVSVLPDGQSRPIWLDLARDTLHLHWHTFLSEPADPKGFVPLQLFAKLSSNVHTPSICADLLDCVDRVGRRIIMQSLMKRSSWSVCGAVVCIHATDRAAIIESGLWGALGEEPIVLVDARNTKRLAMFRAFWQTHGTEDDDETNAFFEACVDDVPRIHYVETPSEFLQDLEIRWLHDCIANGGMPVDVGELQRSAWLMTPEDFDGRGDDPRQVDYGDLPGRPFARQLWSPNREHPWVQDALREMPVFQPTVMFRLCIDDCLSKIKDSDREHGRRQD